jgi:spore coat assembly protein
MKIGDTVVRKSYNRDITFKIIDVKNIDNQVIYVLNGVNLRIVADAEIDDLEEVTEDSFGKAELVFNKKVNQSIRSIVNSRNTTSVKKKIQRYKTDKN